MVSDFWYPITQMVLRLQALPWLTIGYSPPWYALTWCTILCLRPMSGTFGTTQTCRYAADTVCFGDDQGFCLQTFLCLTCWCILLLSACCFTSGVAHASHACCLPRCKADAKVRFMPALQKHWKVAPWSTAPSPSARQMSDALHSTAIQISAICIHRLSRPFKTM